ncbi:MAG TPA: carboxypeptidase-like regulatory domain-containing protein, partial [Mucilaginibacter sp.]
MPLQLIAQNVITGKVTNVIGKNSVSEASVFLNNTTIGSKTLTDGSFVLRNVRDGGYKLIVSCVGYETYTQTIIIDKDIHLDSIKLIPKINEL